MQFALISNGRVVEVFDEVIEIDGRQYTLAERYHPDFIAQLVPYVPEVEPESPELVQP